MCSPHASLLLPRLASATVHPGRPRMGRMEYIVFVWETPTTPWVWTPTAQCQALRALGKTCSEPSVARPASTRPFPSQSGSSSEKLMSPPASWTVVNARMWRHCKCRWHVRSLRREQKRKKI